MHHWATQEETWFTAIYQIHYVFGWTLFQETASRSDNPCNILAVCDENMEAELQRGERAVVVVDDDGDEVLTRAYFIALKCIPSGARSAGIYRCAVAEEGGRFN